MVIPLIITVVIILFVVAFSKVDTSGGGNTHPPTTVSKAPQSNTHSPQKHYSAGPAPDANIRRVNVKRVMQIMPFESELYKRADKAWWEQRKTICVSEEEYNTLNDTWHKSRDRELALAKTVDLNNRGTDLEKSARIEEAIKVYEECIAIKYPATHAYERLMVLYRRIGAYDHEQRVISIAIEVFSEENKKRAENAKKQYPEYAEQIDLALETNEKVIAHNNRVIFNQYDVLKYFDRYAKSKALLEKKRGK